MEKAWHISQTPEQDWSKPSVSGLQLQFPTSLSGRALLLLRRVLLATDTFILQVLGSQVTLCGKWRE